MKTRGSIIPSVLLITLSLSVAASIGIGMWKHYGAELWRATGASDPISSLLLQAFPLSSKRVGPKNNQKLSRVSQLLEV
jgi:hypothetical protein